MTSNQIVSGIVGRQRNVPALASVSKDQCSCFANAVEQEASRLDWGTKLGFS